MRRTGPTLFLLILTCCLPASAFAAGPPSIVVGAPSDIRNHEATLNFSIDPEGLATTYWVEYGRTTAYSSKATFYDWDLPTGDAAVPLSQVLSVWKLQEGTTYHYRVVAESSAGTTYSVDQVVTTTDEPPPTVETGGATDQTATSAVLHGTVDPGGRPVTVCRFHYVNQSVHGRTGFHWYYNPYPSPAGIQVPCEETPEEIGSGDEPVPVHAVVPSYSPGLHQFRIEAENAFDEGVGEASPFGFSAPSIQYLPAEPRNHEATLRFSIDPSGLETTFELHYGDEAGIYYPNHESRRGTLPAGDEPVTISWKVPIYWEGPLWAGTEYHWKVVATNAAGTSEGAEQFFTTSDLPPPQPANGPVSQSTTDLTRFHGTVDPEGLPVTACHFRWVTESVHSQKGFEGWGGTEMVRFGQTVPCEETPAEIGSGTDPVPVRAEVSGIEPGHYWVRLEADNAYEDGLSAGWGVPFEVTVPKGGGQGCPNAPGCGPAAVTPTQVTPTQVPQAKTTPRKRKPRKHQRKRVRHNMTIVAPR